MYDMLLSLMPYLGQSKVRHAQAFQSAGLADRVLPEFILHLLRQQKVAHSPVRNSNLLRVQICVTRDMAFIDLD
jgi:hypothetical protein